jgi:hypothetical protein
MDKALPSARCDISKNRSRTGSSFRRRIRSSRRRTG